MHFPWQRQAAKQAKSAPASSRPGQKAPKFLPQLEALEHRQMPSATILNVTTTADIGGVPSGGTLSLRQAIEEANTNIDHNSAGYIIQLMSNTTYQIAIPNSGGISEDQNVSGDFDIRTTLPVTIQGGASGGTVVEGFSGGGQHDRVFDVGPNGQVNFNNLTIQGGDATVSGGSSDGGGLRTAPGSIVKLTNVIVQDNQADQNGGGIAAGISGFSGGASGGSGGSLTLINSFVRDNSGGQNSGVENVNGGGIAVFDQTLSLSNTQVTSNTLGFSGGDNVSLGGGVSLEDGGFSAPGGTALSINNSTISKNQAVGERNVIGAKGGGIYAITRNKVLITNNSTIGGPSGGDGNIAEGSTSGGSGGGGSGGGIFVGLEGVVAEAKPGPKFISGTLTIQNSLIANNIAEGTTNFSGGSDGGSGGGIFVVGSRSTSTPNVKITKTTITENEALGSPSGGGHGGGIAFSKVNALITGGSVSDNTAGESTSGGGGPGQGGGIFLDGTGSTLTLTKKAAVTGNHAQGTFVGGEGGGIFLSNFSGGRDTLNVSSSSVSGNFAQGGEEEAGGMGGGIASIGGIVHLTNATIDGNTAKSLASGGGTSAGGGIFAFDLPSVSGGAALFSITKSTISNNTAGSSSGFSSGGGLGGGIALEDVASAAITASTIDHNHALTSSGGGSASGGGIYNADGVSGGINLTITNSTISNNEAMTGSGGGDGGGMFTTGSGSIKLLNDTLAYNQAASGGGGGIEHGSGGGLVMVENTIIANNTFDGVTFGNDVSGSFDSLGHNLIGFSPSGGSFSTAKHDQFSTDSNNPLIPGLALGLANNGGPTQTIALLPGSKAIDKADGNAPPTDQRGFSRMGIPDVGAFEFQGISPPPSPSEQPPLSDQ